MDTNKISNNMLTRLPEYLNYVKSVSKDVKYISATKIANELELGEVLVRKDLARISDGGRCKLGYLCEELIKDIEKFLDIKNTLNAVVVGKGESVKLLLDFDGFEESGVLIKAGFDISNCKKRYSDEKNIYPISKLESYCKENKVTIGILFSCDESVQEICDKMISAGINVIWNFTSIHLKAPKNIIVHNENIAASVIKLRMQIKELNNEHISVF